MNRPVEVTSSPISPVLQYKGGKTRRWMSGWESAWAKLEGTFFPPLLLPPSFHSHANQRYFDASLPRPPPSCHSVHKIGFCSCNPSAPGVSGLVIKHGRTNKWFDDCANFSRRLPNLRLVREATWITSNLHPTSKFNEPAASAFTTVYHPAPPCESSLHR